MNFSFTDLTHPTAVKNSFSKTVTLPGTPTNNAIFDKYFDTKHLIVDFDPADRIPFELFAGSNLIESGYLTLDRVVRHDGIWEYELTLFGGIGDFLYTLSSSTLEDLSTYFDTDIIINKELVKTDWDTNRSKSKSICWIPEYGGLNDGFKSNVVTYDKNQTIELEDDIDQFSMCDFRTWCQRPAVFVSEIIEGICAQSGFDVEFDQEWSSQSNPYWENLVVTMPKLSFAEKESVFDTSSYIFEPFTKYLAPSDASFYTDWQDINAINLESFGGIVQPTLDTELTLYILSTEKSHPGLNTYDTEDTVFVTVELCFYNKDTKTFWQTGDRIVFCSQNASWSKKEHDIIFRWSKLTRDDARSSDGAYYWKAYFYNEDTGQTVSTISHKFNFDPFYTSGMTSVVPGFLHNGTSFVELSCTNNSLGFKYVTNENVHSGKNLNWVDIVKSDVNQCDFLLSYLKTFGLLLTQDKRSKSVKIMPRNAFFKNYVVLNWT